VGGATAVGSNRYGGHGVEGGRWNSLQLLKSGSRSKQTPWALSPKENYTD
jgi:hypothetical protein